MSPLRYLNRFLDASDPTASLKHAAYALVVVAGCCWLSWDLVRGPINAEWVAAFGLLLGAVTTGKVVGSAPSPAPTVGNQSPSVPGSGETDKAEGAK